MRRPAAPAERDALMRTLFDKVWDAHVVHQDDGGPALLYVDLHLVHEVTSPQAFEGLRLAGRRVRRPELTLATVDHNVPTGDRRAADRGRGRRRQVSTLVRNAREVGHRAARPRLARAGNRARDRPGAGTHPAGHGHRLRRLPHLHPRRVRGARVRDRDQRGGARACHPVRRAVASRARWRCGFSELPQPGVSAKDLILALIRRIGTAGAHGIRASSTPARRSAPSRWRGG